jgi:hypothetical protein
VIVRISGSAYDGWFAPAEITVRRRFTVRVSPRTEWGDVPRDAGCPGGPPPDCGPPPERPRLPDVEELRAVLPHVPGGGRADEAKVRRALASLDLPPAIRTEVKSDGGRGGVLLSVRGNGFDAQDCVLARVSPGTTEMWVPPRIQRMPGEGGCFVANALDPAPPPH